MTLLALCMSLVLSGPSRSAPAADSLYGMWGAEADLGPTVKGSVVLSLHGGFWTARMGKEIAPGAVHGDTAEFVFGLNRLRVENLRRTLPRAFWIQRARLLSMPPYATPVRLIRTTGGGWRGTITPLEQHIALYLDFRRDTTGAMSAIVRNPDGTFGDAVFNVSVDGDSLQLQDPRGENKLYARILGDTIALKIPGAPVFRLTRRQRVDANGLFAQRSDAYTYHVPAPKNDGIAVGAVTGPDTTVLMSLLRQISATDARKARQPLVHSLLIAQHGKLVVENYFFGFDANTPHDLRSASKSFVSTLAGIAGLPPTALMSTAFTDYKPFANADPRKDRITLAHLLSMSSGLACDDNDDNSPGGEGNMQTQTAQRDWYKYTLDLPMMHAPSDTAAYCSAGINLAGGMVARYTHEWIPSLLDRVLMQPLGISNYHVNLMPTGDAYMGGGVYLRPRDLLKIGLLYLQKGRWQQHQIVPAGWVFESTRPHPEVNGHSSDGYMWHTNVIHYGGRDFTEIEANGNGGQLLMMIPELELAVVITAGNYNSYGVWHNFRDEWLPKYIIPGLL